MRAVVRAELTKIVTLPSVLVVTALVLVAEVVVLVQPMTLYAHAAAGITADGTVEIFTGHPMPAARAFVDQLVAGSLQSALFLPVLGAVAAGQEFRGGQLGTSVLAVPTRLRLLLGKVIAIALYTTAVAVVVAVISTLFMYRVVASWDPSILWSAPAVRGQVTFVLFAVAYTVTIAAITLVSRRTLVGILAVAVFLGVTVSGVLARFAPAVDALTLVSAARNLLLDPAIDILLDASPAHAAVVVVGWVVLTVAGAAVALRRRDAR